MTLACHECWVLWFNSIDKREAICDWQRVMLVGFRASTQPTRERAIALLDRMATTAFLLGMWNASKHLRQYLNNSPNYLLIDVESLIQSSKEVRDNIEKIKKDVLEKGKTFSTDLDYEIKGSKQSGYVVRTDSPDWFFAMGGYTYWYTARYNGKTRSVQVQIHFEDTYNWDQNKVTSIEGITFSDKVLGTLHQAGLAREYPMGGSKFFTWKY
jgi:hypothetical protein